MVVLLLVVIIIISAINGLLAISQLLAFGKFMDAFVASTLKKPAPPADH